MRLETRMRITMCMHSVRQLNWFVCFFLSRIVSISIDCVAVFHIQLFTPIGNGLSTDYIFFLSSSSSLLNNMLVFFNGIDRIHIVIELCRYVQCTLRAHSHKLIQNENVHKRLTHPTCLMQPKNKLTRLWCISVLFFMCSLALSTLNHITFISVFFRMNACSTLHWIEQTNRKKAYQKNKRKCVKYNRILFEFNWNW